MNNPAVRYGLFLLFFMGMGEVFLRWKSKQISSPWKFRAGLLGVGLLGIALQSVDRAWMKRFNLMLYGAMVAGLLVVFGCLAILKRMTSALNRILMEAQSLHDLGQTTAAIELLKTRRPTVARMGKSADSIVLTEMARYSLAMNDAAAAEVHLRDAEEACPLNQGLYAVRAEMLGKFSGPMAACEALKAGLEKLPKSVWLNTELAEQLANAGRDHEAREVLARTIELMDREKSLDVLAVAEWKEQRIGPLVQRLTPPID